MVHGGRDARKSQAGRGSGHNGSKKGLAARQPAQKKGGGKLTSVKNQIRSVKRLLTKGGLLPKAVAEQQRRLEQLTDSLEDHQKVEKQRKYAVKYHKVRFFERVKIERRISKLEKEPVLEGADAAAERTTQLAALRDDLLYVMHFPREEKYVALFRQAEEPAAQAALDAERARLRGLARARAADAALVAEPDEGASLALRGSKDVAQAADDSDPDDFFLASDDDSEGATAARDGAAASVPDIELRGLSNDDADVARLPKGKGKQRQRPERAEPAAGGKRSSQPKQSPRQRSGGTSAAALQEQRPQKQQQHSQGDARPHRQLPPAGVQKQAAATRPPSEQAAPSQRAHLQARAQPEKPSFPGKPPGKLLLKPPSKSLLKPPSKPAAPTASAEAKPKEGQPLRRRAEGGRKRRKKA